MNTACLTLSAPIRRQPARPATASPVTAAATTDHDLMLAVRDGDIDALGELFERHHRPLFGFLTKLTGERAAAEDVAQNVFQRMLKYRHTYRDDGSFSAWMYHLARRGAADHFRQTTARSTPVDPSDLEQQADEAPAAAAVVQSRDDQALLRLALQRLERDEREVLLLSRLQELSFAEIAGILECSVGAARVRAHRALQALRAQYFRLQATARP